ncbi:hypothetical protein COT98_01065 [Candidatus Falkowbacteria bacterium CG10_big_fil_rev_8_21_14_0_10_39_9]|uniref:Uncharacterized protein n=1 Tax=Candidatus Falkowbacteria bacterium CG10_big_fil_rev_8_21_14_0_10_39_9 TaxID=1974566 RepID=A0A2M6WQT3_9BACT|nr:MAG: hypothetical protein COT98_01065 [Candidatus Falkowbacteria bacterium CG10_big_fil_rev_8_21_14_0_10_39_9]
MIINTTELQKFFEIMESKNLSFSEIIALINGKIADNEPLLSTDEINLTVDYNKTPEQAVADGNYDYKNSGINGKKFPISPEMIGKKVDIAGKLFHFHREISSEDAISEMDKKGYRPATLMELLALGAAHPELQREFLVIALGSIWHLSSVIRCVPCLRVGGSGRELNLRCFGVAWVALDRFFGVRK